MKIKTFSLIMATYGRKECIDLFIKKLLLQKYDLSKIQLIIVDQNEKPILDDIVKKYIKYLNILHIKSSQKGLSYNRNLGLKYADGEIIAFPDDDCYYYEDTLLEVSDLLDDNVDCVLGRIYDYENKRNVIREWGEVSYKVTWMNFYTSFSSITMFLKNTIDIKFDENFGVGACYGSCEDADFIVRMLREGYVIEYNPRIVVWHPSERNEISIEKIEKYGYGFGAFCRKNLNLYILMLFAFAELYHVIGFLKKILYRDWYQAKKKWVYCKSRVFGFYAFKGSD